MTAQAFQQQRENLPDGIDTGTGLMGILRAIRIFGGDQLDALLGLYRRFGSTFRVTVNGEDMLIFTRPEHIRAVLVEQASAFHKDADYTDKQRGLARFVGEGLLTSDGAKWKKQRKLVAPAFHTRRIANYADTMTDYTSDHIAGWRDGETRDMAQETSALTLRIVGKTLFDVDASGEKARPILVAMHAIQESQSAFTLVPEWFPTPTNIRKRRSIQALDRLVFGMIAERQADSTDRGDLLSMLVSARDEDGSPMDDRQIRDEAVTLFLAGHETTANTLNWTLMLLAQNPHIEAALREELDRVLDGRAPTLADLDSLVYTEQVIKESMRLYPPAWVVGRVAVEDTVIGDYNVAKGTRASVVTYITHRDPALWDSPDTFDPTRFTPEREATIPRYAYLPFGGGPRVCIGNHFAMMEAKLLLAGITSRWSARLPQNHTVEKLPRITLNPKNGMPMILTKRR